MSLSRRLFLVSLASASAACQRDRPAGGPAEGSWWPEKVLSAEDQRAEITLKIERITGWLRQEQLGGLLLSTPWNFAWLTAGAAGAECREDAGDCPKLLVRWDGQVLVVAERASGESLRGEELEGLGWQFGLRPWHGSGPAWEEWIGGRPVAADTLLPGTRHAPTEVDALRSPLLESEVRKYRWLGNRLAECVEGAGRLLAPGMTEYGIGAMTAARLLRHAIEPVRIRVAADRRALELAEPRSSESHKIEQLAVIVATARRWGLHAAVARWIHIGRMTADLARRFAAAARVEAGAWARTVPGSSSGAVLQGLVADGVEEGIPSAWEQSSPGGSIGYRAEEWRPSPGSTHPIGANQAFTWRAGADGLRFQETILLVGDTLVPVTVTEDWPLVEIRALGCTYRLPTVIELR